jgi:predicted glycosyltransferase
MNSRNGNTHDRLARAPGRTLRIVLYGQSLSGTGHFVRIYEIARALAARHEVHLIDGGRPVPRPRPAHPFALVAVPRIYRRERRIMPVDQGPSIDVVMAGRRRLLFAALERIRPDALVVEHFPFSKWGLRDEIMSLVERARAVAPRVRVLASVRDIPPGTGDDPHDPAYRDYVLGTLRAHFDGLLVHTDPTLVPFREPIPWSDEIGVPVAFTGYVSEKVGDRPSPARGQVIVSTGGAHLPGLVDRSLEAWRRLRADGATEGRRLVVFLPPFGPPEPRGTAGEDSSIRFEPFTPEFLTWMAGADLSISQAGYNTCTNVLETRARAVVVPSGAMSDQGPRARRLAERGLVRAIPAAELTAERLAATMIEALAGRGPAHALDLDGAERTRSLIEEWCAESIRGDVGARGPILGGGRRT